MTMLVSSDHTQQNRSLSPDSNNDSKNNQQQQQLTLDIICPMWARRLEQSKHLSPLSLTRLRWYFELQRISRCVVAEAYGFSSSYMSDCKKCSRIGWKFMFYFMLHSYSKIEENKNEFVKHWSEKHNITPLKIPSTGLQSTTIQTIGG